ncbi:hypothetical protein DBR06_SOUSAS6610172, partial [Sousa chinensis]
TGRERYRLPELAQDCPLLAQSDPLGLRNSVSRRGRWPRPFSASSTRGGCRWQHLWGRQLRLSPRADAELLRPRLCAQPGALGTGICRA